MKQETFINENRPHESAIKHVTGKAYYTDDIPDHRELYLVLLDGAKKLMQ